MTPTDKIKNVLINTLTQPTDYERYILDCINPDATFEQVHNQPHKVYEIINCSESEARVLVFEAISKIYNEDYDVIYNKWLSSDDDEELNKIVAQFRKNNLAD